MKRLKIKDYTRTHIVNGVEVPCKDKLPRKKKKKLLKALSETQQMLEDLW